MSAAARTPSPQCSAAAPQEATDERPFEIPDWLVDNTSPAPVLLDTSDVDPHRVEDLVNRFIAGKQDALFLAPDAYYRTGGRDAVGGVPDIVDRLDDLRNTTLQAAGDEATRFMLAPRLDAHLDDARYGIDRHVTAQHDALTRQIIGERQRLIQNAAQLEHNNGDKLAGLAEAHATARPGACPYERRARGRRHGRSPIGHLAHRHRPAAWQWQRTTGDRPVRPGEKPDRA